MILRPYKKMDNDELYKYIPVSEKELFMWCAGKFVYPFNHFDFEAHMQKIEEDPNWFSLTYVDSLPIGNICFHYLEDHIHLGFIVCKKGFGQGMLNMAIKYAFTVLGISYLTLNVYKENPRAVSCYKKVGFKIVKENDIAFEMQIRKEW